MLSPLSERDANFEVTYNAAEATTLLNGSEANRDVSHVGDESPFLLSSRMKRSIDADKSAEKPTSTKSRNSPLRNAKKSAVAEIHQAPFLFN